MRWSFSLSYDEEEDDDDEDELRDPNAAASPDDRNELSFLLLSSLSLILVSEMGRDGPLHPYKSMYGSEVASLGLSLYRGRVGVGNETSIPARESNRLSSAAN